MTILLKSKIFQIVFLYFLSLINCTAQQDTISIGSIDERAELFINLNQSEIALENKYNEIVLLLGKIETDDSLNYLNIISNAQKHWEIYSEFECKITEFETRNGAQGGLPFYNQCKIEMNNQRIEKFSELLINLKREFNN